MLWHFRKHIRTHARRILVAGAGLWLITAAVPCVMAAPHCPGMGTDTHCAEAASAQTGCQAALDCALPDSGASAPAVFDFAAPAPVILATLPATNLLPPVPPRHLAPGRLRSPEPPLNLQHARLLI